MKIKIIGKMFFWIFKLSFFILLTGISYKAYAEYYIVNPPPEPCFQCYSGCQVYRPCYYKTTYIHSVSPKRHQPTRVGVNEYEWISDP